MEKVPEPRLSRPRVACDLCGLVCRSPRGTFLLSLPKRCRRQHGGVRNTSSSANQCGSGCSVLSGRGEGHPSARCAPLDLVFARCQAHNQDGGFR